MITNFTLRRGSVLNGILILFSTGVIISHPAKRNTVVFALQDCLEVEDEVLNALNTVI